MIHHVIDTKSIAYSGFFFLIIINHCIFFYLSYFTHTHTHIYIHTHTHTYTHTHIHTHTSETTLYGKTGRTTMQLQLDEYTKHSTYIRLRYNKQLIIHLYCTTIIIVIIIIIHIFNSYDRKYYIYPPITTPYKFIDICIYTISII